MARAHAIRAALRTLAAPPAAAACRPRGRLLPAAAARDWSRAGEALAALAAVRRPGGLVPRPGAAARAMSTDADKEAAGSLLSSVFGADGANAPVAADLDDGATAERHQNRKPKARTMAEGKKTLKPWSGGGGGAKQNELIIDVVTEHIKVLIGKRGAKVQAMMEESGAKIFISKQEGQDSSKRRVAIRGTAEAVQKAKELIDAQVHYAETAAVFNVSEMVKIPTKHVGLVIGKGGATVKAIESETGAVVKIDTR